MATLSLEEGLEDFTHLIGEPLVLGAMLEYEGEVDEEVDMLCVDSTGAFRCSKNLDSIRNNTLHNSTTVDFDFTANNSDPVVWGCSLTVTPDLSREVDRFRKRGTNGDLIRLALQVGHSNMTQVTDVKALLDTGCVPTSVSKSLVESLGYPIIKGVPLWLKAIDGSIVELSDMVEITLTIPGFWTAPTKKQATMVAERAIQQTVLAYVVPGLPAELVLGSFYMRTRGFNLNYKTNIGSMRVHRGNEDECYFYMRLDHTNLTVPSLGLAALTEEEVVTKANEDLTEEDNQPGIQGHQCDAILLDNQISELTSPTGFPAALWPYVMRGEKAATHARWSKYTEEECAAIDKAIAQIYIEQGDRGRLMESPFFRAQAYANADVYIRLGPDATTAQFIPNERFAINLKSAASVVGYQKRWSQVELCYLSHRIPALVRKGQVRQSTSSFNNPVLLVVKDKARMEKYFKQHGAEGLHRMWLPEEADEVCTWFRLVGDYRELNSLTIPEPYPLPIIQELLDNIPFGCDRYSCSDLPDAFFSIRLKEGDEGKTAFRMPFGSYEYVGTPQGTRNAAMKLSSIVARMYANPQREKRSTFQDDLLCYEPELCKHITTLQNMYDITRTNNLTWKPSKTLLNCRSMRVLGHIVGAQGRSPDPTSIASIMGIAPPENISDVKSICGLANVTKDYVHLLTRILEPIQALTKKGTDVKATWKTSIHGKSLDALKIALTSAPILLPPDPTKPYKLITDACKLGRGLGAILCQQHPLTGEWHPVQYWSKALSDSERRYSATELECMAVAKAVVHWGHYLRGPVNFEVVTDHYALVYMMVTATKSRNGRLETYIRELQDYNFTVTHRRGIFHLDADAVSRLLHYGDTRLEDMEDADWRRSRLITDYDLECIRKYLCVDHDSTPTQKKYYQEVYDHLSHLIATTQSEAPILPPGPEEVISSEDKDLIPARTTETDPLVVMAGMMCTYAQTDASPNPLIQTLTQPNATDSEDPWKAMIQYTVCNPAADMEFDTDAQECLISAAGSVTDHGYGTRSRSRTPFVAEDEPTIEEEEERDVDTIDDLDSTVDPRVVPYHPYLGQTYRDTTNNRLYELVYIYFDLNSNAVVGNVVPLDGQPTEEDNEPIYMDGEGCLMDMISQYQAEHGEVERILNPLGDTTLMSVLQRDDPVLGPIIAELESQPNSVTKKFMGRRRAGQHPTIYFLEVTDDISLLKVRRSATKKNTVQGNTETISFTADTMKILLAVPACLTHTLIKEFHDKDHVGVNRLVGNLSTLYYWHGMKGQVKKFVRRCVRCGANKAYRGRPRVPIQSYGRSDRPMDRVHWDITGQLPTTLRGHKYILILKCALTGWVEIFGIPNKEAITVAEILVDEIYCRHGSPRRLVSDRGSEFNNRILEEVCRILRIRKIHTTAYNPRSDGLVENHMGILKDQLRTFTNLEQNNWDDRLAYFAHAYNTTVNTRTGYTPFFLMYGREARAPNEEYFESIKSEYPQWTSYAKQLHDGLQYCWLITADK